MAARTQLTPIGGSRRYGFAPPSGPHPLLSATQLTAVGGSRRYGSFEGKTGVLSGPHELLAATQLTVFGGSRRYGSFAKAEPVPWSLDAPIFMDVGAHTAPSSSGVDESISITGTLSGVDGADVFEAVGTVSGQTPGGGGGTPPGQISLAVCLWLQAQAQSQMLSQRTDASLARYLAANQFFELNEGSPSAGTFFSNGRPPSV